MINNPIELLGGAAKVKSIIYALQGIQKELEKLKPSFEIEKAALIRSSINNMKQDYPSFKEEYYELLFLFLMDKIIWDDLKDGSWMLLRIYNTGNY